MFLIEILFASRSIHVLFFYVANVCYWSYDRSDILHCSVYFMEFYEEEDSYVSRIKLLCLIEINEEYWLRISMDTNDTSLVYFNWTWLVHSYMHNMFFNRKFLYSILYRTWIVQHLDIVFIVEHIWLKKWHFKMHRTISRMHSIRISAMINSCFIVIYVSNIK
jgi:hypothetical protein